MVLGTLQDAGYDCISAEHADAALREPAIREFGLERLSVSLAAQAEHEPSMLLDKVLLSLRTERRSDHGRRRR